ncbi:hypothetical protein RJ639_000036 [Escallonia herrerae]|uniref:Uncharacterized protein n=1 Tax=Escallonia herrerae TaxID=1293975 RepID=A0AA88XAL3_9ASTE|nr:hypothetical protein RJ639_000036 [Escallonia herrerae]
MATKLARAISRRSAPPHYLSTRLLSSSPPPQSSPPSITDPPPIPTFRSPFSLSHPLLPSTPTSLNLIRCRVNRPGNYSPLNSGGGGGDRPPTEMAPLFPGCDYEHWLIVMDKPGGEGATKEQMIGSVILPITET